MFPAESQNTEWKESWNDDYLRWVCGFANAYGGRICIGKNDRGETVGLSAKECRKLCEDIPNKVRDTMGGMVDVNLLEENGKRYVESWGRGIEKMSAECSRVGSPAPTYDLTSGEVMICFEAEAQGKAQSTPVPRPQQHPALTERQRNLLQYLRVRPQASYEDMAEYCRVSRRTVSSDVKYLMSVSYLEREGADKNGLWVVNRSER